MGPSITFNEIEMSVIGCYVLCTLFPYRFDESKESSTALPGNKLKFEVFIYSVNYKLM